MTLPDESSVVRPVPCPHGIQPNRLRTHSFYLNGVAYDLCEACFHRVVAEGEEQLKRARLDMQRRNAGGAEA